MTHSSMRRGAAKPLFLVVLSLILSFSVLPILPCEAVAVEPHEIDSTSPLSLDEDDIASMLDAGDYAEGEVIVLVDNLKPQEGISIRSADLLVSAESLMTVSGQDYAETYESAENTPAEDKTLARMETREYQDDESLSIRLISNTGLSTEELITTLKDDPRVLFVEPNYQVSIEDELTDMADDLVSDTDEGTALESTDHLSSDNEISPLDYSNIRDLSRYQWGNENNGAALSVDKLALGFDINPPLWSSDRTTAGTVNATGTIAIVDTGIDYTHPDLNKIVRNDMQRFVAYGGSHGYNTGSDQAPEDPMDTQGHGTHCAGIVAAEWNSYGTSGVASGVQLIAVRSVDVTSGSMIKSYDYLADAVEGGLDNLVGINNSWGYYLPSQVFPLAVTSLGRLGAVSVFASGNDSCDNDVRADLSSMFQSNPYCVVVNSSTMTKTLSEFSQYGRATTDLVAPGSTILSTIPMSQADYLPEAITDNTLYESFNSSSIEDISTKMYKSLEDAHLERNPLGSYANDWYYDDENGGSAWKISTSEMENDPSTTYGLSSYMTIPVDAQDQDSLHYLSFHAYPSALTETSRGVYGVRIEVLVRDKQSMSEVWKATGRISRENTWVTASLDLSILIAQGYELVYPDDKLMLKLGFANVDTEDPTSSISVDAVATTATGTPVAYGYKDGTSMATPAATGALGVLALLDDPYDSPDKAAMLRAARLQGSTIDADGVFSELCTSGGSLDLSLNQEAYCPVISSASVDSATSTITFEGYFFGANPNEIKIGSESVLVQDWSDTKITVACPPSLSSGFYNVQVVKSTDRIGQKSFILTMPSPSPDPTTPLFENEHQTPEPSDGFPSNFVAGELCGLYGEIYMLNTIDLAGSSDPLTQPTELWAFNPENETWRKCQDLPVHLVSIYGQETLRHSSVVTHNGKLLVYGTINSEDGDFASVLLSYNPLDDSWTYTENQSIPINTSMANCQEELLFIGGEGFDEATESVIALDSILSYDITTDQVSRVGTLPQGIAYADIAVYHNEIYVINDMSHPDNQTPLLQRIVKTDEGYVATDSTALLPMPDDSRANNCSISAVEDGIMLTGFSSIDSSTGKLENQDSFLLKVSEIDQGAIFEGIGKRASYTHINYPGSTAYQGEYYVVGTSYFEDGGIVFRSTLVNTLDQPGELYDVVYHNADESSNPNPLHYSPSSLPLALTDATKEGSVFTGWYETQDLSGTPLDEIPVNTTGALELWAGWHDDVRQVLEISGSTRIQTALENAKTAYPGGINGVIIARSDGFADALSAGALAYALDYPILLTDNTSNDPLLAGELNPDVAEYLTQSGIKEAIIVGSSQSVTSAVFEQLHGITGGNVTRLGGADRVATQMAIFNYGLDRNMWGDEYVVTTADVFADALSISAYASYTASPVFIVSKQELSEDQKTAIKTHYRGAEALILGSTVSIDSSVENWLNTEAEAQLTRLAGGYQNGYPDNRYGTSAAIADYCINTSKTLSANKLAFATGESFADALVAGPTQAKSGSMVILTTETQYSGAQAIQKAAYQNCWELRYLGTTNSVAQSTRDAVERILWQR